MSNTPKILCPVDFSRDSDYGVAYAEQFAKLIGAEVHCIHVVDTKTYGGSFEGAYVSSGMSEATMSQIETHVHKEFDSLMKRFELLHFEATGHFVHGDPAKEIIKLADELDVNCIVMATHGRTGFDQFVFGSTCEKVVRLSHVPVLTVRPQEKWSLDDLSLSFKRVLCTLDFSDFSKAGLTTAVELCKKFDAKLVLAHALDTRLEYPVLEPGIVAGTLDSRQRDAENYLAEVAKEVEGVECETHTVAGNPHVALLKLIEQNDIDLVVMTTHGHRGLSHLLLGSITERIVKRSSAPVLTIHPDKDKRRDQVLADA